MTAPAPNTLAAEITSHLSTLAPHARQRQAARLLERAAEELAAYRFMILGAHLTFSRSRAECPDAPASLDILIAALEAAAEGHPLDAADAIKRSIAIPYQKKTTG